MTTREEWRNRILADLGGEGTDPELTEQQLDSALARAIELWNKHRPHLAWFPFDVRAAQTTIIDFFAKEEQTDARRFPDGYVRNVLAVNWQDRDRRILGPRAGFLEGFYLRWGYQGPRLYFQLTVANRTYERLTGSRPDWYWNPTERKLYLSSARDTRAMVLCSRERHLEEIPYHHEHDFLKAAVARAKYYLARNLGARGPIPGAAGAIETDAADLRTESKEEWKEVESRLETAISSWPSPEYIG
jgi:hypothetical protein